MSPVRDGSSIDSGSATSPQSGSQDTEVLAMASPASSPKGKKRRLDEDEVEELRTKQFRDDTMTDVQDVRPLLSRAGVQAQSSSTLLRAAKGAPAEGQGLRGVDAEVNTDPAVCGTIAIFGAGSGPLTTASGSENAPPTIAKSLCIRHQCMADEDKTARLQKSIESLPLAEQTAVNTVWSLFSSSPHPRRALMLQGLLPMCCSSQLSLLSHELSLAIRLDPFSLFPREVSLRILKHLDAISLGRTAQVSRTWKSLADDDLLWRNMCEQHIERKCEKCGWGLPLLSERRKRAAPVQTPRNAQPKSQSPTSAAASAGSPTSAGQIKRAVTAAANAAALQKNATSRSCSRAPSPSPPAAPPSTRPWKTVYCERLAIERNWRSGRYTTKVLSGHTDGIMCLQFNESFTHPAFPILITGSYDRTARVWSMETGEELRVLKGHTRGVRCLQFDEAKLITGSMDRTLKIWNWRTGELMRTLEGHTEGIVCLNYNNDILASGSADSNIKIWNFRSGECFTLRGHTDWVNAVLLWSGPGIAADARASSYRNRKDDGTDSTFLFSASDDGTIRLWDLYGRESLLNFDGHVGQVQSIKLVMIDEATVHKLVTNAAGGHGADHAETIQRREMRTQRMTQAGNATSRRGDNPAPTGQDGRSATGETARADGDPNAASCGYNPPTVPGGRAAGSGTAPAISDHFTYLASGSNGGNKARRKSLSRGGPIDEQLLLVQRRLYEAGLVEALPIDAEMADLEGPLSSLWTGQTSIDQKSHHPPQRPIMISASLDNTIRLWCVRTGRCIRTLFGHTEGIWSLSLDKLRIASASHDRCIKTWDTDTGTCKQTFVGHRGAVTCVQLGDDKIVSGSDDGDCRIWSFAPQ